MKYFLELSYNGFAYHGWQVQDNAPTVQQKVNEALSAIFREDIKCMGSGRTDTGVHALIQVAHFDCSKVPSEETIYRLNGILPADIAIKKLYQVRSDANVRFDAVVRGYTYRIHQHKNPFLSGGSYFFGHELDVDLMNKGCDILRGNSDFESFSKVHTEVNNFLCDIFEANWKRENDGLVFCVRANRFLRGMVRAIVGTLLDLGQKKLELEDLQSIIEGKNRKLAGRSVPALGLYLSEVQYPADIVIN